MLQVGQEVVFVDEPGCAKVMAILSKGFVQIEDEHGFLRNYPANLLAPKHHATEKLGEVSMVPSEKTPKVAKKILTKEEVTDALVDLHIENLVTTTSGWTNKEIVDYQMNYLKNRIKFFMQKRVKKVHIIHGVGAQVLRQEVHIYLRSFPNCEVRDAVYTRNGFGATDFFIRYKGL
jgi:hypothetical protein